jgi:hypothetical protein
LSITGPSRKPSSPSAFQEDGLNYCRSLREPSLIVSVIAAAASVAGSTGFVKGSCNPLAGERTFPRPADHVILHALQRQWSTALRGLTKRDAFVCAMTRTVCMLLDDSTKSQLAGIAGD